MKSVEEIIEYIQERINETAEDADRCEEQGLDESALTNECIKQELEEVLEFIKSDG